MSKIFILIFIGLFIASMFSALILAADDINQKAADIGQGAALGLASGFKQIASNALSPLFGDKELFTKFLFAVLIFMIVYSIISVLFAGSKYITWIIALIVTILAVLWIPPNFITAIRDQYGVMGATILSVIPFAIMLMFTVRVGSLLLGRIVWLFYVVYYFTFFCYEWVNTGKFWAASSIPYLGAIIAGGLIFFLLGPIRNALFKGEMSALKESGRQVTQKAKLLHKLQGEELNESYGAESAGNK